MEYAAVVPGLVKGELRLLVHDQEGKVWSAGQQLAGRRQPNDARTDDHDVVDGVLLAELDSKPGHR